MFLLQHLEPDCHKAVVRRMFTLVRKSKKNFYRKKHFGNLALDVRERWSLCNATEGGSYSACLSHFVHMRLLILRRTCACLRSWHLVITGSLGYCSLIRSLKHPAGTGDGICLTTHRRLLRKVSESSHPEIGS